MDKMLKNLLGVLLLLVAAVKQFDPTRSVNSEDLEALIEAANLTATSGGFQPFKLIVVGLIVFLFF